jgi:hypothetical protein
MWRGRALDATCNVWRDVVIVERRIAENLI